jgi:ribosomal protein S18 acetylase RimI-like enzyme
MTESHAQPGVLQRPFTATDRAAVEALAAACGRHDGADYTFVTDMALTYDGALGQPLAYRAGRLVGMVSLQSPDTRLELSGLVHPDDRRRGIGTALLASVRAEARSRSIVGALVTGDESVPAGMAFARAVGATYRSSEYRMVWAGPSNTQPATDPASGLERVTAATLPAFAHVHAAAVGYDEESARRGFAPSLDRPGMTLYLARLDGEAVGVVRTHRSGTQGWITALGVVPERRRRGVGRRLLLEAATALRAAGAEEVLLEVATDNQQALTLYHASGFRTTAAYAYHFYRF